MKPPAFQFYADDFLAGVADMTNEEVGAYIRLLCHQWTKGGLPKEPDRLSMMAGAIPGPSLGYVLAKFRLCDDGFLRNDRLEKVREEQAAFRKLQAEKGAKGASARWKNGRGHHPAIPSAMAQALPKQWPDDGSPSPTPIINTKRAEPSSACELLQLPFGSGEFRTAWETFCRHRKEIRKELKPTSALQSLKMLAAIGEERAINCINHTVAMGWQGLREPEGAMRGTQRSEEPVTRISA